jgi:siroheme synthase
VIPSIFGRLTEELDALRNIGIKATVVPGVTAATAAASTLGISLTRRRRFAIGYLFLRPRSVRGLSKIIIGLMLRSLAIRL